MRFAGVRLWLACASDVPPSRRALTQQRRTNAPLPAVVWRVAFDKTLTCHDHDVARRAGRPLRRPPRPRRALTPLITHSGGPPGSRPTSLSRAPGTSRAPRRNSCRARPPAPPRPHPRLARRRRCRCRSPMHPNANNNRPTQAWPPSPRQRQQTRWVANSASCACPARVLGATCFHACIEHRGVCLETVK